jgi:hypothetical protein
MKTTIEQIKLWGFKDWLCCFAPKPISYIGDLWDYVFPRYRTTFLDKIGMFFKPRQKWIKKHIEYNSWCDKVELIPDFLFGCIVHYVEEEKCFEVIDWDSTEKNANIADELQECYEYIIIGRSMLEYELDYAYNNLPDTDDYKEKYAEVVSIEKAIEDSDQYFMKWIVKNKNILWT